MDKLIAAAHTANAAELHFPLADTPLHVRCVEYHQVRAGGELKHSEHYDSGYARLYAPLLRGASLCVVRACPFTCAVHDSPPPLIAKIII